MPEISLTDFVDIASLGGRPKTTKIRQIKSRPNDYDPITDFYKRAREYIIELHKHDRKKEYLEDMLIGLSDQKKQKTYPLLVKGYKKWLGRKSFGWVEPVSTKYSEFGVDVSVNPELGVEIDNKFYLIKLYFKSTHLEKNKVDLIIHLMSKTLSELCNTPIKPIMGVLDVRKGKLFTPTVKVRDMDAWLESELAFISTFWVRS